jgi:hypothetical protein
MSTVTYSTPYSLKMDIYQPAGDTLAARPLIILAHGGSFTSGDRTDDSTVVWLCRNFALRGYVTASIDYRLTNDVTLIDSAGVMTEVVKALSDGKAAIRYFYQDAYTTNTYKIDTSNIFIGGNSAGSILYLHCAYIDSVQQVSAGLQATIAANGGLQGNSGNAGYSGNFKAVINLAGGLNDPTWIIQNHLPIVSAQGDSDPIVPYDCGQPEYGIVPVRLCGLGVMQSYIAANASIWASKVYPGAGHVPWQGGGADFDAVDTLVRNFLYHVQCGDTLPAAPCPALTTSIDEVPGQSGISLYPNPATGVLHIRSVNMISGLAMYDETGRLVEQATNINEYTYHINTSRLSQGIYTVRISGEGMQHIVSRVAVE